MLIGYARVSTDDQNLELQRAALGEAGCTRIYEEKLSGANRNRPELARLLDHMRGGDVVVGCGARSRRAFRSAAKTYRRAAGCRTTPDRRGHRRARVRETARTLNVHTATLYRALGTMMVSSAPVQLRRVRA
jgi:resolvase-like protein